MPPNNPFAYFEQNQTPGEQVGFQEQIMQRMAALQDPAQLDALAAAAAQQGPPPPPDFINQIVGSGDFTENANGLPMGQLQAQPQPQPQLNPSPAGGFGLPPSLAQAQDAQRQAAAVFGGSSSPVTPPGGLPQQQPNNSLQQYLAQLGGFPAPGGLPRGFGGF